MTDEDRFKKIMYWAMIIFALLASFAFILYLLSQQQQQHEVQPAAPIEAIPTEAANQPTVQQKQVVLNVTYKPEVVTEGQKQKLTFQIKNETGEVLIIKEAKINWYWNQGQGFSLAEREQISGNDPRWLSPDVPAWSTKTVLQETTTASGRGVWRGEITVYTNLKNLTATVIHTVERGGI